jgi:hypothetical protein
MAPERTGMRNSALASAAALTSVALLGQSAGAAQADEGPSREEVSRRVSSLYDRAETDTGTFNATRASSTGPRNRAGAPPASGRDGDGGRGSAALVEVAKSVAERVHRLVTNRRSERGNGAVGDHSAHIRRLSGPVAGSAAVVEGQEPAGERCADWSQTAGRRAEMLRLVTIPQHIRTPGQPGQRGRCGSRDGGYGAFMSESNSHSTDDLETIGGEPTEAIGGETIGGDAANTTEKDPEDWVTGDEPMTGAQRSYLDKLARDAGETLSASLTKAEASEHIERLQAATRE